MTDDKPMADSEELKDRGDEPTGVTLLYDAMRKTAEKAKATVDEAGEKADELKRSLKEEDDGAEEIKRWLSSLPPPPNEEDTPNDD
jgi:hypothetical protein